ncbi:helix-turn-helix domain-containing protein [Desulfosporosinus acidiphilus]|nr:helix-turn-helix domain-containing protein [Desulfosporosinus acidiphilus]
MAFHFESREDLEKFIRDEIFTSSEAMEYLGITRQALNAVVQRGKLIPIKEKKAIKLFFKEDLVKRIESLGRDQD